MSSPIPAVDGIGAASPVGSRQVRSGDRSRAASEPGERSSAETSKAVAEALRDGGNKIVLGGRSAEFSYDESLDRVIVRIYSSETPPREVVRQFPPEEYLAFVTRFREMFGVLFDHTL
jgi:uncharacterized FlaG/YvyC family protein